MNTRPLMLGIVGDNASGKTTFTRGIVRILGGGVTPIALDDYLRYSRTERSRLGLTALDPAAYDIELLTEHLATLRSGGAINKPMYDHRSGTLRASEHVIATNLVIAYGMLTLTTPELAAFFDLTIFVEPDEDLRRQWEQSRDISQRGYTPEQIEAQAAPRKRDAERYIRPQRRHVDAIIHFSATTAAPDSSKQRFDQLTVRLIQRRNQHGPLVIETIAAILDQAPDVRPYIQLRENVVDEDGLIDDEIEILGTITATQASILEDHIWRKMPERRRLAREQLGVVTEEMNYRRQSDTLALTQLLVAYQLDQMRQT